MKSYTTLLLLVFSLVALHEQAKAQVGIGTTTPDGSAILDLTTTSKGLLVPRMTEAQKTGISSPAGSLLIYQTDNTSGFWYFDGVNWQLLTSNGWATTGNGGTNSETNFLGTTDDNGLTFKVNNQIAGQIGSSTVGNTSLGYLAGSNNSFNGSTFIGYNAGTLNSSGSSNCALGWNALTTNDYGSNNTAIGYASMYTGAGPFNIDNSALGMNTLYYNQTGAENTAVGSNSLYANVSGTGNSAVGQKSLYSNVSGTYNCVLGVNGLYSCLNGNRNVAAGYSTLNKLTSGNNNTALGYAAGDTIISGSNNTFVGSNADGYSTSVSNSTALGYNAKVTASNCLVLGSVLAVVNVGIGVPSPSNALSLDGKAARTIWMERNTNSGISGFGLTLQAGGAFSGGSTQNLPGGDLTLSSGTSTGTASSNIAFKTATPSGTSSTTDNAPSTKMVILGNGNVGIGTATPVTTLQSIGSLSLQVRDKSGAYTIAGDDYLVVNTGSAATWTLPTAASYVGRVIIITNHGSGTITTSIAYRTASGTTTSSISTGTSVQLISDGTDWDKVN